MWKFENRWIVPWLLLRVGLRSPSGRWHWFWTWGAAARAHRRNVPMINRDIETLSKGGRVEDMEWAG